MDIKKEISNRRLQIDNLLAETNIEYMSVYTVDGRNLAIDGYFFEELQYGHFVSIDRDIATESSDYVLENHSMKSIKSSLSSDVCSSKIELVYKGSGCLYVGFKLNEGLGECVFSSLERAAEVVDMNRYRDIKGRHSDKEWFS